jgi:hypothetical protein
MPFTGLGEPFYCGEVTSIQLRAGFARDRPPWLQLLAVSLSWLALGEGVLVNLRLFSDLRCRELRRAD